MQRLENWELKEKAKAAFHNQAVTFVLGFVILFALSMLGQIPGRLASMANIWDHQQMAFSGGVGLQSAFFIVFTQMFLAFLPLIIAILLYPATAAYAGMSLQALAGRKVEVMDVFSRFREMSRWIAYYFFYVGRVMLWSMLFVIPGIMAALSYSQAKYLMLKDPKISPWDAIEESTRLMRGNRTDLFVLGLSFILWWLLVLVTFGLAILYVSPYVELTMAAFHRNLVGDDVEQGEASVDFA